jgi:hypothetical protein
MSADSNLVSEPAETLWPSWRFAVGCVLLLAAALLIWKVAIALSDPSFGGDAGLRLSKASQPVMRVGNRVWLPYLQVQIWFLYLLKLPYAAYNLIACAHFFVAVLFLGLLGLRIIGCTFSGLAFSLVVMFSFAQQRSFSQLSVSLYQEIPAAAFFYLLLYSGALVLARRWWLVAMGGVALLCRDTFWIYLFSLTLLNRKEVFAERSCRRSFAFLWAVPILWLLVIPLGWLAHDGRLPSFPTEWPLMVNKEGNRAVTSVVVSLRSLWASLVSSRAVYLLAAGAVAWAVHFMEKRRRGAAGKAGPADFVAHFRGFSALSLGIAYVLIVLFDPWQATFGAGRMSAPLLEQAFLWSLIAFSASGSYRPAARVLTRVALVAGLLAGLNPQPRAWRPQADLVQKQAYAEIQRLVDSSAAGRRPVVCWNGNNYFQATSDLVAPTLYASREWLPTGLGSIPRRCDAILMPSSRRLPEAKAFRLANEYLIRGTRYALYLRRR